MVRKDSLPSAPVMPTAPQALIDNNDTRRHASYDRSFPRTPPSPINRASKGKGKAKSSRSRPALPEAYNDDNARGDVDGSNRKRSDSHDLSWSPRQTRDSVVDNMLLSLDQLFVNTSSTNVDSPLNSASIYTAPLHLTSTRTRGHTFSSSISSEADDLRDEAASRSEIYPSRRHRSNSSSNFQSALGRIDSVRAVDEERPAGARNKCSDAQGAAGPGGDISSRLYTKRKGSKSSGSSSLDFGQMMGSTRWQRAVERRSSSFDHGSKRPPFTIETSLLTQEPPRTSISENFAYENHDAAPTPTVRAGPRRDHPLSPMFPLPSPHTAAQTLPLRRRASKKPPATLFSRHEMEDASDTMWNRDHKGSRLHTRTNSRDMSAVSITASAFGQSPSVSSRKPSAVPPQGVTSASKERPGFFRRVFGSSRNTTPTSQDLQSQQRPIPGSQIGGTESRIAQSPNMATPSGAPRSKPPAGPAVNIAKETPQIPLNKKPSFFRRRKKSVSEDIPLPVHPLQSHPDLYAAPQVAAAEPSPVSSLRKVMNPYIQSPVTLSHLCGENDLAPPISEIIGFSEAAAHGQATSELRLLAADDVVDQVENQNESHASLSKRDNRNTKVVTLANFDSVTNPPLAPSSSIQETELHQAEHAEIAPDPRASNQNPMNGPMQSHTPSNVTSTKENEPPKSQGFHSRSGSNKDLPKLPKELPPLSTRDGNLPSPGYTGPTSNRTRSTDWHSTYVSLTPTKDDLSPKVSIPRSQRALLHPATSEEDVKRPSMLPLAHESHESIASDYKSATSKLPTPTVELGPQSQISPDLPSNNVGVTETDESEPTEESRLQAKEIYDGVGSLVDAASAAAWLGDAGPERTKVRKAYMDFFDWHSLNILAALRSFCNRLTLKGETQQVDRILDALSNRWCACNPNHGFKATDVVHTICYSILLLNTDLHIADIEQKMTRSQFIKNTMPTIRRVATDAAPYSFDAGRGSMLPPSRGQLIEPTSPSWRPTILSVEPREHKTSIEGRRPSERLVNRPSDNSSHEVLNGIGVMPLEPDGPLDDCGPLVMAPFHGRLSAWEAQVEIVLKEFYNSIRQQRLPLSGSDDIGRANEQVYSSNSLSAFTGGMLRRTPSMLSKAASESQTGRGRLLEARMGNGRWSSKTRSRPRLYPSSIVPSSRTSFDDESSAMSPSASSIWSKYSLGKTQTSMSVNSFSSSFPHGDYQQSIGFANALSQAIIREETSGGNNAEESLKGATLLEDETLELAGAPWAKEGILKHKHHLESVDKKAKDRHWNECFAVIEKGWMRLFQFNMNSKSMRLKAKNQRLPGGVVGGGNWTENAEALGKFLLRQTIASALPPPGYSKLRPHVWALSLPTGAVHLFQVGTPDIVKEFVTTANYWSARLSKEPLIGGISNVEYGWGDGVINPALVSIDSRPPSNLGHHSHRPSLQSSLRSSLDQGSSKPKLPGDRIMISDWTQPQQSMMATALMEVDQLKALTAYVKSIEDDLQRHNQLRGAMLLAFSPRHPNHNKAMANWQLKSSYLLREIVKFRTYMDCLQAAQTQKEKLYAERAPPAAETAAEKGIEISDVIIAGTA